MNASLNNSDSQYVLKTTFPINFTANYISLINSFEYFRTDKQMYYTLNSLDENLINYNRSTDIWISRSYLTTSGWLLQDNSFVNGETDLISIGI